MSKGDITLLCGPNLLELGQEVAAALGTQCGMVVQGGADQPLEAITSGYTKLLLRCMVRVGLGQRAVVWLPDAGPSLEPHQRRALERVVQGLAPAVLVETEGGAYPSWLRVVGGELPVWRSKASNLDLTLPSPRDSSNKLVGGLLEEWLAASRPCNPGGGTGSWRPGGVLLVGDRPNPRRWRPGTPSDLALSWPFISQTPGGCSAWLSERLEEAETPESELYWVNAFRASGEATCDLAELRSKLQPRLVVALGKQAAELLKQSGVAKFEQVHHPQHWKRFHFSKPYRLVRVLQNSR